MVKISKNLCFVEENCYVARLYMYIKYSKIHSYLKEKNMSLEFIFSLFSQISPFLLENIYFIYLLKYLYRLSSWLTAKFGF